MQEQTAKIEAAIEAGEFDKAVELVNEVPEGEVTPELREQALANIEEKRSEAAMAAAEKPEETPAETKPEEKAEAKDPAPDPEKPEEKKPVSKDSNTKNAIKALKGFKTKEELEAFIEGEDRKTVLEMAKVRMEKLAQVEKEKTSKGQDIEPAIAQVKALPSKEEITAFIVGETRPEVIEAAMAAGKALESPTDDVARETIQAVNHAKAHGFHDKMANLVKKLPAGHPYKVEVLKESEAMRLGSVKGGGRTHHLDRSNKPPKKAKKITSAEIVEDWQALYDKLTRYESQQKKAKAPFRHVIISRRNLEVRLSQFKRNCR